MNSRLIVIGSTALTRSEFGQSSGSVVFNDLTCSGSEARLIDCPDTGTVCSTSTQAAVRCQVRSGKFLNQNYSGTCANMHHLIS